MRLDMLPRFSMDNKLYGGPRNTVFFSYFSSRTIFLIFISKLYDDLFRKLGSSVSSAFAFIGSSLEGHVFHILLMCPKKEMVRPNTRRIVALMEHKKAVPIVPIGQNPGYYMRASGFSIVAKLAVIELTGLARNFPFPTKVSFNNLAPKSFHKFLLTREVSFV